MGAEISNLKDINIGVPYEINDEGATNSLKVTVCPAKLNSNGQTTKYTTFSYTKGSKEQLDRQIDGLKTNRHPSILKYIGTVEKTKQLVLVTEFTSPLETAVQTQEREEIVAGIFSVLKAVIFLNERGSMCHNNIVVPSIFVTDSGAWKLGSFEHSSKVSCLAKNSFQSDAVQFAEFALSIFEYLQDTSPLTQAFVELLEQNYGANSEAATPNSDAAHSASLKSLVNEAIFTQEPLIYILDMLENMPLKTKEQKKEFFRTLHSKLVRLSPMGVARQVIPHLFSYVVLSDDALMSSVFLEHLFASGNEYCQSNEITPIYAEEYFNKHSLPRVLNLFESRDIYIRMILIKHLPLFVDCVDKLTLANDVLPQLLLGLQDVNDDIVTATFHALANLVPVIGGRLVVGGQRNLVFVDQKPNFSRCEPTTSKDTQASNVAMLYHQTSQQGSSKTELHVPKSSSSSSIVTASAVDEKTRKREERERRRDEQKRLREEKRKEKENEQQKLRALRVTDEKRTAALDESSESIERSGSQPTNTPSNMTAVPCTEENVDFSDAEWEGFEALSNDEGDTTVWGEDEQASMSHLSADIKPIYQSSSSPGTARKSTSSPRSSAGGTPCKSTSLSSQLPQHKATAVEDTLLSVASKFTTSSRQTSTENADVMEESGWKQMQDTDTFNDWGGDESFTIDYDDGQGGEQVIKEVHIKPAAQQANNDNTDEGEDADGWDGWDESPKTEEKKEITSPAMPSQAPKTTAITPKKTSKPSPRAGKGMVLTPKTQRKASPLSKPLEDAQLKATKSESNLTKTATIKLNSHVMPIFQTMAKVSSLDKPKTAASKPKINDFDNLGISIDPKKMSAFKEPDYFADIFADVSTVQTTVVVPTSQPPKVESKFEVAPLDDAEEAGGWGDDDGW